MFIPGMDGVVASSGGAASPLTTISVIGANHSINTNTVAYPAELELRDGDAALFFDFASAAPNTGTPAIVIPAGYTQLLTFAANTDQIDHPDSGRGRVTLSYKILNGLESGVITGMSHQYEGKFLMVIRGNTKIGGVTLHSQNVQGFDFNPVSHVIAAASGQVPLLVFSEVIKTGNAPAFTQQTPAFATVYNPLSRFIVGYTRYNVSPVNHTVDSDALGVLNNTNSDQFAGRLDGYLQFTGVS